MNRDRLELLLQKHLDGQATSEEYRELAGHLACNPEARRFYAAHLQLHALLEWGSAASTTTPPAAPAQPRFSISWQGVAIAAAIVLTVGAMFLLFNVDRQKSKEQQNPIARLTRFPAGNWMDGKGPKVGENVFPGTYILLEGNAELALAGGRVLLVEAPAQLQMLQNDRMVLHQGSIVTRGTSKDKDFTIETAAATILDRCLEIGVAVAGTGETVVQVYKGKATIQLKGKKTTSYNVNAGKAVEINKQDGDMREVSFSEKRFVRELPNRGEKAYTWLPPYNQSRHKTMYVPAAPKKIVIDGDLNEWNPSTAIAGELQEPFSNSFYFSGQMVHDNRFLYIAAHVGDPSPMKNVIDPQMDPEIAWRGGGVQVRLSTSPELGWPLQGSSPIGAPGDQPEIGRRPEDKSENLVHLTMWYFQPEALPCLVLLYGMDYQQRAVNPEGWRGAFRRDTDGRGYTLEYAVPWKLLNAAERPPHAGDVLGASWQVHWSDQGGRLWRGHLIELTRPNVDGLPFLQAGTWGKAVYR